ncbi:MAG TPA: hypothetical protein VF201_03025 [Nitrolancea sp.]
MRKLLIAFAMVIVLIAVPMSGSAASGTVIYDSTVSPLPGNLVSVGFEATSTSELGDEISFAGTSRALQQVTVTMSSWACESGSWTTGDCETTPGATFPMPITFTIYNVGAGDTVGSQIATVTQTFDIPYRPSADNVNCSGGTWYSSSDGKCYNGFATNITFDFSTLAVTLPDSVIYGISYNTSNYGDSPLGVSGPYDSLNVALSPAVSVGSQVNPGTAFVNSSWAGGYCAEGPSDGGSLNVFRLSLGTCWDGYVPAVQFIATGPAPTSKDQCKNGGWQQFDNPHFKNQGDCIQFVNTGK